MDDVSRGFDDRAQVILERLDTRKWDLLVGEVDSLDRVQHVMWRLMDPAHPAHDRVAATRFGDAIERMYRRCDDFIGEVVKHAGDGTVVMVVSAYGEHGVSQTFDLNRWLALEQLPGKATATSAGGIILGPDAHGIEDHLIARLTALLDPATKAPVISAVYKRDAVYSGPYVSNAPDLQVGFAPGYGIGSTSTVFAPNKARWSADHATLDYKSVPGTLISSRPTTTETPRVIDLAPTVLRYFCVPIPTEIDGTPIF
jgi:predicted AlkP superfamily phosphohydrolase/phosphomutase